MRSIGNVRTHSDRPRRFGGDPKLRIVVASCRAQSCARIRIVTTSVSRRPVGMNVPERELHAPSLQALAGASHHAPCLHPACAMPRRFVQSAREDAPGRARPPAGADRGEAAQCATWIVSVSERHEEVAAAGERERGDSINHTRGGGKWNRASCWDLGPSPGSRTAGAPTVRAIVCGGLGHGSRAMGLLGPKRAITVVVKKASLL